MDLLVSEDYDGDSDSNGHLADLLSQTHLWGNDLELRERVIGPHLTEEERFDLVGFRSVIQQILPTLYQKYGPWLIVSDFSDDDLDIWLAEYAKQRRDWKAGHKKNCQQNCEDQNLLDERALSHPVQHLILNAIRDFALLAEDDVKRAAYSAMDALSASRKIEGRMLVLHVKWNEEEPDPSLAFELCDAQLSTDAEVIALIGDFLFDLVNDYPDEHIRRDVDNLGRRIDWIGRARILYTDAATTRRDFNDPRWVDGMPMVFTARTWLERMTEARDPPSRWRACTDRDWHVNLKRVLGKSAKVETRGRTGKMMSLRHKEYE
ncbi:hypothetical protein RQP46_008119 [Phenoliferia psychrophenolica]